jgi:xanthine dehydrogenase accessory factor
MKNIYLEISSKYRNKKDLVLATVTRISGSTPQVPGSSALFDSKGLVTGTVGGGYTENKVREIAMENAASGRSGHYHFNLHSDIEAKDEAICGGRISVLVDADPLKCIEGYDRIKEAADKRINGVLVTKVTEREDGSAEIERTWVSSEDTADKLVEFLPIAEQLTKSIFEPRLGGYKDIIVTREGKDILYLLETVMPRPKLVIAGAGHVGKAVSHIGNWLGFEVTVIDDREEFANRENLPSADHFIVENIEKALSEYDKKPDTFIVIATRGHSDDAGALRACINSGAGYIGMIGSHRKVALMKKNFIENGIVSEDRWNQIYTPVGLEINSKTVEEIAVSIAAQMIKIKNN